LLMMAVVVDGDIVGVYIRRCLLLLLLKPQFRGGR